MARGEIILDEQQRGEKQEGDLNGHAKGVEVSRPAPTAERQEVGGIARMLIDEREEEEEVDL